MVICEDLRPIKFKDTRHKVQGNWNQETGIRKKVKGEMADKLKIGKDEFINIIKGFINDHFFGDYGEIKEESSFLENGIIDSTGILELVAFLEEKFGISVDDDEIVPENMDSLKNVADFLQRKLAS